MRKSIKRVVGLLTALSVSAMLSAGVFAETPETVTVDYDSTVANSKPQQNPTVPVEVSKAEFYCVKLPKKVLLDGSKESPSFEYTVNVQGTINPNKVLRVIPQADSYLETDTGYVTDLEITQTKQKWTATETETGESVTGTMQATDLKPGDYKGFAKFFVSLDDGFFYTSATCTTGCLRIGEDLNDNGVFDEDTERWSTPIAISKPLGHKYSGEHTFSYDCERCHQSVYEITNVAELKEFRDSVNNGATYGNKTIELLADIDLYEETTTTPWDPIGNDASKYFSGTFNGNGHYVKGIKNITTYNGGTGLNKTVTSSPIIVHITGFFGNVRDGVIKNFVLKDSNMSCADSSNSAVYPIVAVGAIVGASKDGNVDIDSCRVSNVTIALTTSASHLYAAPYVGAMYESTDTVLNLKNLATTNFAVDMTSSYSGSASNTIKAYGYRFFAYESESQYDMPSNTVNMSNSYGSCLVSVSATNGNKSASPNSNYCITPKADSSPARNISNTPYDTNTPYAPVMTDEELQTQTGVDLLNTGYTTPLWKLDLENVNYGYPIIF